ncbi:type II toxin-antitoxin system VapB family antitoxin [Sphingomonas sp. DT-207]|uniref:type II toxin-antitoxin system VapB family antitoxin n=1 Tax=Sphingomonas sp. DT-207 TaxID=3396167 RepID=UPI003F1B6E17
MASLYIKDSETAELADRIARRLGKTKTEVVRNALRRVEAELPAASSPTSTAEWLREFRQRHPLPPRTGPKADKVFFDWLSGEENV